MEQTEIKTTEAPTQKSIRHDLIGAGIIVAVIIGILLWMNFSGDPEQPRIVVTIAQAQQELGAITMRKEEVINAFNYFEGQRSVLKDSAKLVELANQQLQRRDILNALEGQKILIMAWMNDSSKVKR